MASRPSELVMDLISRFCEAQFLYDYADDEKLRQRINAVLRRVQLAPLPTDFLQVVPDARKQISCRREELLEGESSADLALLYPSDEGDRI
jgi:hypothetical protein